MDRRETRRHRQRVFVTACARCTNKRVVHLRTKNGVFKIIPEGLAPTNKVARRSCFCKSGFISLLKSRLSTLCTSCARKEPTDLYKKRKYAHSKKYAWLLPDHIHRQRVLHCIRQVHSWSNSEQKIGVFTMIPDSDTTSHQEGPLQNYVGRSGIISLLKPQLSTLSTFCAIEEPTDVQEEEIYVQS